jgi:hypothetical protein
MPESILTLCQSRLHPPARNFGSRPLSSVHWKALLGIGNFWVSLGSSEQSSESLTKKIGQFFCIFYGPIWPGWIHFLRMIFKSSFAFFYSYQQFFHSISGSDFGKVSVPVPNLDQNLDSNLDLVPDLIQHSFRTKFLHNLPF